VVFGVYAAGLAPSLLAAGPLSDRYGRRRLVVPCAGAAAVASLLFVLAADSFALLLAARLLQGLVSGAVFTAGSAWLVELCALEGEEGAAGRRATVRLAGGFAVGPFVSAVVAVLLPGPLVLPYVLHALLVVACVLPLRGVPETAPARPPRHLRTAQPLVPGGARLLALTALAPVAVCVYALPSTVAAALPLLVPLPGSGVLAAGVLAGLTLGSGALVAPLQRRLGPWTAVAAAGAGTTGFALTVLSAATGDWPWLLPAAALLGAGGGWSLAAGLSLVVRLAPAARRGALTGVFYTCAYVGFAAPFAVTTAAARTDPTLPLLLATALTAVLTVRLLPPARAGRL
jgi:MFS family permease